VARVRPAYVIASPAAVHCRLHMVQPSGRLLRQSGHGSSASTTCQRRCECSKEEVIVHWDALSYRRLSTIVYPLPAAPLKVFRAVILVGVVLIRALAVNVVLVVHLLGLALSLVRGLLAIEEVLALCLRELVLEGYDRLVHVSHSNVAR
jgi:hypothetical protein